MTTVQWSTLSERAAWIYYQLRLKQTNAAAIGAGMRPPVSRRVMSAVISGEDQTVRTSKATRKRVQRAVAKAIGVKYSELWGKTSTPIPIPPGERGCKSEGDGDG